jgi:hypothetical protein
MNHTNVYRRYTGNVVPTQVDQSGLHVTQTDTVAVYIDSDMPDVVVIGKNNGIKGIISLLKNAGGDHIPNTTFTKARKKIIFSSESTRDIIKRIIL